MAMVSPRIVGSNGGDGTVQAALTELYSGGHFGGSPPPVAVLPNGKTNLIALDLGAEGDPIKALQRVVDLVESGRLEDHVIERQRSEEHTSELQSLMRISYAVFCLQNKTYNFT